MSDVTVCERRSWLFLALLGYVQRIGNGQVAAKAIIYVQVCAYEVSSCCCQLEAAMIVPSNGDSLEKVAAT